MASWQVQDAKARFSEFLAAALAKGPQIVTRRGVDAAVLVPFDQWRRLEQTARPSLKAFHLAPEPRQDDLVPARRRRRRRVAPALV